MEEASRGDNRDSWADWISTKVATAEEAFTTAFSTDQPIRSSSMHDLRAVARASRLARAQRHREANQNAHSADHDHDEVLPPLQRRASGIDVTLSNAWGAVRRTAVAAMSTFDQPTKSHTENPVETTTVLNNMTIHSSSVGATQHSTKPTEIEQSNYENPRTPTRNVSWDAQTHMSDVTETTSLACVLTSRGCDTAFADSREHPSSTQWEHIRTSTASSNQVGLNPQGVLTEHHRCTSNVEELGEYSRECKSQSPSEDDISKEELNELLHAFNIMFEQNGGSDCVSRVKEIGDDSLAVMKSPDNLIEAVGKELYDAKQMLDETLLRLDSTVRAKVDEELSENADASAAAEAVIEETKENNVSKNIRRRNASLLRDCSRLLAVFATKICASVLQKVEGDKDACTWSERVERIETVSSQGIPQLRIISNRFAQAMEQGRTDEYRLTCRKDLAGWAAKVADAAVEQVVQCVALAVAAMQVEVAQRAYECCI